MTAIPPAHVDSINDVLDAARHWRGHQSAGAAFALSQAVDRYEELLGRNFGRLSPEAQAERINLGGAVMNGPTTFTIPARPNFIFQRVRFIAHGGRVALWMVGTIGVVQRFTRAGNPVIGFSNPNYANSDGQNWFEVSDTYGCAALIDDDDRLIRVEVAAP